ncbi:hypothetical protein [Rhizobium sp. BK251]|uniref:hypothetical protein n=1 Tax=Rhizobium sp. BK251 TaxID=2512125 RepID=UPI00104B6BD4|nr:hypothetical protein [Rhizobium sp. BK251]
MNSHEPNRFVDWWKIRPLGMTPNCYAWLNVTKRLGKVEQRVSSAVNKPPISLVILIDAKSQAPEEQRGISSQTFLYPLLEQTDDERDSIILAENLPSHSPL